jgi:trans-aconitate methyltransferase
MDRKKTRSEVLREFDAEKWGPLRARLQQNPSATVDDVEAWETDLTQRALVTTESDVWRFMSRLEARRHYMDLVATTLARHLPRSGHAAIAELGCGFGAVVLRIAARAAFARVPFLAAELSVNGQDLTRQLAANAGIDLTVGDCDLTSSTITSLPIPPGAVIYTSYAAHYLPTGHEGFVEALTSLKPAVVIHFEPIYEHANPSTTLGLMRRRYIEVNGYTRDLAERIRAANVRVLVEQPAVFGENPLLPASIIAWAPHAS